MSETPLPPLYARWVEGLLGATIPEEHEATCSDCAMCKDDVPAALQFRPDAKCCTYHPQIVNFQVGLILADASPEAAHGRDAVARKLNDRLGATPLGISRSPAYALAYGHGIDGFGRDLSFLCPYFITDGGRCGIWRYRNSVCSTYFCRTVRGAAGSAFWKEVKALLQAIEMQLSIWCLSELSGFRLELLLDEKGEPRKLSQAELRGYVDPASGQLSPYLARQLWGDWYGQENNFYRACAARVADLDWQEIKSKASVRFGILEARVREAFTRAHSDSPPPILCKTNFEIDPLEDGLVQLRSPAVPYAPLRLSAPIAAALVEFDGRPTGEVMQAIATGRGVEIDSSLLKTLFERGIVAPPNGTDVPQALKPDHPLRPDDQMGFFRGFTNAAVSISEHRADDGSQKLIVRCGAKELEFDEPDLFEFARNLVKHQNGFLARDAMSWSTEELAWPRVEELLTAMLEEHVLQRFPSAEQSSGGGTPPITAVSMVAADETAEGKK
jgi:hypothetical protein